MSINLIKIQKLENDKGFYILGDIGGPLRGLRIQVTGKDLTKPSSLEEILEAIAQRAYAEGALDSAKDIKERLKLE